MSRFWPPGVPAGGRSRSCGGCGQSSAGVRRSSHSRPEPLTHPSQTHSCHHHCCQTLARQPAASRNDFSLEVLGRTAQIPGGSGNGSGSGLLTMRKGKPKAPAVKSPSCSANRMTLVHWMKMADRTTRLQTRRHLASCWSCGRVPGGCGSGGHALGSCGSRALGGRGSCAHALALGRRAGGCETGKVPAWQENCGKDAQPAGWRWPRGTDAGATGGNAPDAEREGGGSWGGSRVTGGPPAAVRR